MNKKGFTLAEVLAVIIIMGILITIAIPSINTITKNINKRVLDSKKEMILSSAEKYGKEHAEEFENGSIQIQVIDLIIENYISPDEKNGSENCNDSAGCVINPETKASLNNVKIVIHKEGDGYVAIWNETAVTTNGTLIEKVKADLSCGTITVSNPCVYKGNVDNNYFYYSGVMWRIMGVYNINGTEAIKLITDDTISWEE